MTTHFSIDGWHDPKHEWSCPMDGRAYPRDERDRQGDGRHGSGDGGHCRTDGRAPALARLLLLALALDVGMARPGAAQEVERPEADDARIVHLLNRATFGVRAEDIDEVRALGIPSWLEEQLHPERIPDPVLDVVRERYPSPFLETSQLLERYASPQELQTLRARLQDSTTALSPEERRDIRRELAERGPGRILGEMTAAKLTRASHSERQLEETMTDFWFDHFNVFWGKGADRWLVADYERTAIRANVFGSFEDMLVATASHPAMLFYLDNWRSMAPDTAAIRRQVLAASERMRRSGGRQGMRPTRGRNGRGGVGMRFPLRRNGDDEGGSDAPFGGTMEALDARLARLPGLNENYARELLELHTLGVDGGYTQDDVVAVARAFTGWTLQMPRRDRGQARDGGRRGPEMAQSVDGDYGFVYRDQVHDRGAKTVLGHDLSGAEGRGEGLEVLRILARHPSTARHIATQLATRFVADDPPESLIDHLAAVFLETEGDLREVTRALFSADEFYAPEHVGAKVKPPVVLVASALRVTNSDIVNPRALVEALRSLEQAPYLADAPTGYEEASDGWATSGAMLNRMNFGIALAGGRLQGVRTDASELASREGGGATRVQALASTVLPGRSTEPLVALVLDDLAATPPPSEREAAARALGMMLGSPEFQMH